MALGAWVLNRIAGVVTSFYYQRTNSHRTHIKMMLYLYNTIKVLCISLKSKIFSYNNTVFKCSYIFLNIIFLLLYFFISYTGKYIQICIYFYCIFLLEVFLQTCNRKYRDTGEVLHYFCFEYRRPLQTPKNNWIIWLHVYTCHACRMK